MFENASLENLKPDNHEVLDILVFPCYPLPMSQLNRQLFKREEIAIIAAVIQQVIQNSPAPEPGRPWAIPIATITEMIGAQDFSDRLVGRRVRKMSVVWTRLAVSGRRMVMVPQGAQPEDMITWIDGMGSAYEEQIPVDLMLAADDLMQARREKDLKAQEEARDLDPSKFTGVQAEQWALMTPAEQEEFRKNQKDPNYYGFRGGQ